MRVRDAVAEALGREPETVTVQPAYLGGAFGHKVLEKAQVEAARLSRAAGRPVHLVWSRTEDFKNGFLRPMTHHVLRATLGSDGRMAAMEHHQASGAVALPFLPGVFGAIIGHDFGAWRGARILYRVPDKRTVATVVKLPVSTGWWRGLGLMANSFAIESFVDEMAQAAGVDPLEFRLQHLPDDPIGQRMRTALITAAEQAGWGSALPAGHGRGIACIADYGTVVAEVAEVAVEAGQIRVAKVTAAVDPGVVINPDGAEAQVEGNIVMGLSSALLEEATVKDGALVPENFGAYRLLTMAAAPEIEVVLLQGADTPSGLGEPPIGPLPAAVANAVFAATGSRLRRLPLRLA
jgi:isoquinoline 1-oxidoreductase beta subunit